MKVQLSFCFESLGFHLPVAHPNLVTLGHRSPLDPRRVLTVGRVSHCNQLCDVYFDVLTARARPLLVLASSLSLRSSFYLWLVIPERAIERD